MYSICLHRVLNKCWRLVTCNQDFFLLWAREWRKKWPWKWSDRPGCWFLRHLIHMKQCIYTVSCEGKDAFVLSSPCCLLQVHGIKMQNGRVPKQENAYVMYELIIINCTKSSHRKVFFFWVEKFHKSHDITTTKHIFSTIYYKITENNKETYRKILTHFQKSLGKTKDQVLALASLLLHHLLHCLTTCITLSNITVIPQSSSRTFDNLKWTIN